MSPTTCQVLLLGDRSVPLASLAAALREQGLAVAVKPRDPAAVPAAASADAVVIVADEDGKGCVATIRDLRAAYPDLPVFLVGRRYAVDVALSALDLGVVDYLSRPVNPAKLCERIEDAVERRACLQELARHRAARAAR